MDKQLQNKQFKKPLKILENSLKIYTFDFRLTAAGAVAENTADARGAGEVIDIWIWSRLTSDQTTFEPDLWFRVSNSSTDIPLNVQCNNNIAGNGYLSMNNLRTAALNNRSGNFFPGWKYRNKDKLTVGVLAGVTLPASIDVQICLVCREQLDPNWRV